MTSDHAQLLHRIRNFNIDGNDASALPFAARLARENGWSRAYADRVIEEYQRYVFLSVTGEKRVCLSEDVDAAWHLHLTYTRSYWKRFCGEILGRQLHHEPTKGGPAEAEKHLAMYAETLAAYKAAFGTEPPADIWTPAGERFGDDLKHRAVNTARNWVIPKAPVKHAARLTALVAVLALFVPGCNGGPNPFALQGVDFLYFLIPMMIGAACLGRVILSHLRGPEPMENDNDRELTWEEAAYLSGGSARLTTAAIAQLVGNGVAAVEGTRLVRGSREVSDETTAVEVAVKNALPFSNERTALKPVAKAVEAAFADGDKKLEADGYLLSKSARFGAFCLAAVPLLLILIVFVVPRLLAGMIANQGVPELFFFLGFAGLMISLTIVAAGSTRLTRRGEYVLGRMQVQYAELKSSAALGGNYEAGLGALFGTAVLAGRRSRCCTRGKRARRRRPRAGRRLRHRRLRAGGDGGGGCDVEAAGAAAGVDGALTDALRTAPREQGGGAVFVRRWR